MGLSTETRYAVFICCNAEIEQHQMGESMASEVMKISNFTIYTLEIPMKFTVSHQLAQRNVARNILVCARSENGISGWGESCPRPYVTGETIETVKNDLSNNILPKMIGRSFSCLFDLTESLKSMLKRLDRSHQSAFCAMELAVLDLAGKSFDANVGTIIGPTAHRKVRYSGVIAASNPAKMKKHARLMRLYGFKEVKVKVGKSLEDNLQLLEIARTILGPGVSLRIDANCAWSADEAIEQLKAMSKFELAGVEQPTAADDYDGMSQVTAAKLLPVVADESLCSQSDAEKLIEQKGCDIFNIRISKCGGLINSLNIYNKAVNAGFACQLGAQVGETAILSAAGRHIATRCESLKWLEGSYGKLLLEHDIAKPNMTIKYGGWARCMDHPGLGVEPIQKRINEYTIDSVIISRNMCHI
jgi:muconate cycloisomerase